MSLKEKLKQIIDGLMVIDSELPSEPESEMPEGELPGSEMESEMPEEDDMLKEHMMNTLGRNNNSEGMSKPMYSKPSVMVKVEEKKEMPRRFGK